MTAYCVYAVRISTRLQLVPRRNSGCVERPGLQNCLEGREARRATRRQAGWHVQAARRCLWHQLLRPFVSKKDRHQMEWWASRSNYLQMAYFLSLFQVLESSSMVYSHPSKKWELKLSETIPRSAKIVQKLEKKTNTCQCVKTLYPWWTSK